MKFCLLPAAKFTYGLVSRKAKGAVAPFTYGLLQETFACARNLCFCKKGQRAQGEANVAMLEQRFPCCRSFLILI